RDLFEETRKLFLLGQGDVILGQCAELLHVGPPLLALFGTVLEVRLVAGQRDELVDEAWKRELLTRGAEPPHYLAERDERVLLPPLNSRDEVMRRLRKIGRA